MRHRRSIQRLRFDSYIDLVDAGELLQMLPCLHFKGLRIEEERQQHLRERLDAMHCSFCGGQMAVVYDQSSDEGPAVVRECPGCGFWKAMDDDQFTGVYWTLPFVESFQPQRHVAALSVLMDAIREDPSKLYSMETRTFELLVGSIMREFYNCEVLHVGQSHDGGVDLIVVLADDPIMVQVKRRLDPSSSEGLDVVKNLFATLFSKRTSHGMLVTTAQRFTKGAEHWIHLPALRDSPFQIELTNIDRLLHMLRSVKPENADPGWVSVVRNWNPQLFVARLALEPKLAAEVAVKRLIDGIRIDNVGSTQHEAYVFSASQRDRCWSLGVQSARSWNSVADMLSSPPPEADRPRLVAGHEFYSVLQTLPFVALNALIESWAGASSELVTWEP